MSRETLKVIAAWWETVEMRTALADHDVRSVFAVLERHGWSQTDIGSAIHLSQPDVSRIVSGKRRVTSYELLDRIATAFKIPRAYLGLAWHDARMTSPTKDRTSSDLVLVEPAQRRDLLGVAASLALGSTVHDLDRWIPHTTRNHPLPPGRVGATDVAQMRAATRALWELDQHSGGGLSLDAALGALSTARGLLGARASDAVTAELQAAVADLHSLVGWSLHDVGQHGAATRHFLAALELGSACGDRAIVAAALYRIGRVYLHTEHPDDALRAFQLGQMDAQDAGSYADLARLQVSMAWAYALMGDPARMDDAFARAQDELGRIDAGSAPPWASAFACSGDWDGVRAFAYTILARRSARDANDYAARARELAAQLTAEPEHGRPARSRVFDEIILAAATLQTGHHDDGLTLAHLAVDKVSGLQSVRAVDRLDDILRAATRHPDRQAVIELRERITTLR